MFHLYPDPSPHTLMWKNNSKSEKGYDRHEKIRVVAPHPKTRNCKKKSLFQMIFWLCFKMNFGIFPAFFARV